MTDLIEKAWSLILSNPDGILEECKNKGIDGINLFVFCDPEMGEKMNCTYYYVYPDTYHWQLIFSNEDNVKIYNNKGKVNYVCINIDIEDIKHKYSLRSLK